MCLLFILVKWWSSCFPFLYRSLYSLLFSPDNKQLLCRKQGNRGFPLEEITHTVLPNTGTRMRCLVPPSQLSPLQYLDIWDLPFVSFKYYNTPPKMATSSWVLHDICTGWNHWTENTHAIQSLQVGGREGRLPLFLCSSSEIKGIGCGFLPNILDAQFPLMGIENVNYLG